MVCKVPNVPSWGLLERRRSYALRLVLANSSRSIVAICTRCATSLLASELPNLGKDAFFCLYSPLSLSGSEGGLTWPGKTDLSPRLGTVRSERSSRNCCLVLWSRSKSNPFTRCARSNPSLLQDEFPSKEGPSSPSSCVTNPSRRSLARSLRRSIQSDEERIELVSECCA